MRGGMCEHELWGIYLYDRKSPLCQSPHDSRTTIQWGCTGVNVC